MRRPFVKVCGITRPEDALAAVRAGARAVGFVLVPESPRAVPPDRAAGIARSLPPGVARVGVTVNREPEEIRTLVREIGLTAIQAHGEEPAETCRAYGLPVVKALPAGEDLDLGSLAPYAGFPLLLDAASSGARGGTGSLADWKAARRARDAGYRILLAGGLGPDNLAAAVRAVQPAAVDLNSGVESAPGIKDAERIRLAIHRLADLDPPEESTWPW